MRVGLFIPCYINQFYPQVGVAVLELLERQQIEVEYPMNQTVAGSQWRIQGSNISRKDAMRYSPISFISVIM
jgi:L-lactate dehydrogenase complex protein LldE